MSEPSEVFSELPDPLRVKGDPIAADRVAPSAPYRIGSYRIEVDLGLCQGHAVCVSEAPEVFAFDDDARQVRILTKELAGEPGQALRSRVEAAIRYCPTMALRIPFRIADAPRDRGRWAS